MTKPKKPKIPVAVDRSWVQALPAHAIIEILDVMHDMLGGPLRQALESERWARLSAPLAAWPVIDREISPGVVISLVHFCNFYDHTEREDSRNRRPSDPNHQPARAMFVDGAPAEFECSCGHRSRVYMGKREVVGPWWWPQTLIALDGLVLPVPHYVVTPCVKEGVDDPRHAPSKVYMSMDDGEIPFPVVMSCICGSHPHSEDLQLLPIH